MARITAQNYQSYMKGSNRHIDTHTREMYLGDSPTVQAGYGTYDSKETAHKVACYMFSLDDSATASTPCEDIPRGFTVAIEENNTVVEYQYKKPMPLGGYTSLDLEVKSIANVSASDVSYDSSNVGTALTNAESDIQQLRSDIGTMSSLETTSRNLVGAINEVKDAIPTSMSAEGITYDSSGSHTVGSIAEAMYSAEQDILSLESETHDLRDDVGNLSNLDTPKLNLVSAINDGITTAASSATASSSSAAAAALSASTASGYYSDILTAMGTLGSGEAVAAQVAINQADIAGLKSDVVVDLSTRYATSYANLSAALTALNSDTATDAVAIRKGGMSVKFINSTTDKYEQWNLKTSSWSTNINNWALDVDGSNIPIDKIERENIQSEEQAIIYETDGGVQVGKIDSTGADFTNLKRGGQQVARMSDLPTVPTLDTSIGENPSNNHTPSSKAVKDYVDDNIPEVPEYPIETEITQFEAEEVIFSNDAGTQQYVKVSSEGVRAVAYKDMQGNNVILTKDTSIGETPSQTNVPTSKAVADYVDAHGGGNFPISKETTQSEDEEFVVSNDAGTDTYAKVGSYGVKAKEYLNLDGSKAQMIGNIPITYISQYVESPILSEFKFLNDDESENYASVGDYGIKAKAYLDKDGNPLQINKKLHILGIGNSYTLDSFSYLPIIAKLYGISMDVHIFYYGGTSLQQIHEGWNSLMGGYFSYDNDVDTAWQEHGYTRPPSTIVSSRAWDIISIQQQSEASLILDAFYYADAVVNDIYNTMLSPSMLAWNININKNDPSKGTNTEQAETILHNIQTTVNRLGVFDLILPYGTAIFNARTNPTLDALGDSGHLWADNVHLQEGVPCYIANMANFEAICRKIYPYISIFGDQWRPTSNSGWNIQNPNGDFIPVTDNLAYLSQVAALKANNSNFTISNV